MARSKTTGHKSSFLQVILRYPDQGSSDYAADPAIGEKKESLGQIRTVRQTSSMNKSPIFPFHNSTTMKYVYKYL